MTLSWWVLLVLSLMVTRWNFLVRTVRLGYRWLDI